MHYVDHVYVDRVIGLCLLQNETCPLHLTRPTLKFLLGRPIRWHDLAFHDHVTYETLRKLMVDATTPNADSIFSSLDLNFALESCPEEVSLSHT